MPSTIGFCRLGLDCIAEHTANQDTHHHEKRNVPVGGSVIRLLTLPGSIIYTEGGWLEVLSWDRAVARMSYSLVLNDHNFFTRLVYTSYTN